MSVGPLALWSGRTSNEDLQKILNSFELNMFEMKAARAFENAIERLSCITKKRAFSCPLSMLIFLFLLYPLL